MTHDPLCLCEQCVAHDILCPVNTATAADMEAAGVKWVCACNLIARVREDEQWQASEAVTNAWNVGYLHGLSAARKAVTKLPRPLSKIEALAAIDALRGDA